MKKGYLPHISQRNGVSLVCERIWFARCSLRVYFLPQAWQWWGVSPVCHITWFMKCSLRVKLFLQMSHRCGVSPVCLRTWFTMCSFLVNVFEQYWHLKRSLWISILLQFEITLRIINISFNVKISKENILLSQEFKSLSKLHIY